MTVISFKQFLLDEDKDISFSQKQSGLDSKGLDNPIVKDALNASLAKATGFHFATPYIGLGSIARVLAYAGIIVPQYLILDKKEGEAVFEAPQHGAIAGISPEGEIQHNEVKYFVYFTYSMDDDGYYDCDACLVDADELEELLASGSEDDDEDHDEHGEAEARSPRVIDGVADSGGVNEETSLDESKDGGYYKHDFRTMAGHAEVNGFSHEKGTLSGKKKQSAKKLGIKTHTSKTLGKKVTIPEESHVGEIDDPVNVNAPENHHALSRYHAKKAWENMKRAHEHTKKAVTARKKAANNKSNINFDADHQDAGEHHDNIASSHMALWKHHIRKSEYHNSFLKGADKARLHEEPVDEGLQKKRPRFPDDNAKWQKSPVKNKKGDRVIQRSIGLRRIPKRK